MKLVGLSEEEVKISRREHGSNSFVKIKSKSFFGKFFDNLSDPIIKVLIFALIIEVALTLGHCNYFEIGGILFAILVSTTVSTASEHGSEAAFKRLDSESLGAVARVLRSGKISEIPSEELVVGDVVYLYAGERIRADGVVIEGSFLVDQSALNGEGAEVEKRASKSLKTGELSDEYSLFSGSIVTSGSGAMQVLKVGNETFFGQVAADLQAQTRESPLKLRLAKLAGQISKIGYFLAFLVGIVYIFNTLIADNCFVRDRIIEDLCNFKLMFSTLIHAFTLMITVVVVSAPEGLPMMITVVLSSNMKKMLRDKILVKKLVGIDTAGSMNILFTDKTGTVTSGCLSVDAIVSSSGTYLNLKSLRDSEKLLRLLSLSAKYNTECVNIGGEISGGNATDRAISEFFSAVPSDEQKVAERQAFKSETKYSSVTFNSGLKLFKGAPEKILENCRYELRENGEVAASDFKKVRSELSFRVERGERVIALAYTEGREDELVFMCLLALKDKIRDDATSAINRIIRAGIQVVMITGDGIDTARAIAKECGILTSTAHISLTSADLLQMSDDEIIAILPRLRVVARALPRDKLRLVEIAQRMNLVVGMTGDGINDSPSLKLADIGFSMGSGTDIAKEASDVVILDDSLSAVAKTVLYGRTIFKSIRKFITFQLIMNIAACGVSLLGQFIGIDNPITIIQMLWVNIIMDTLGGLAFAGEAPLEYYMKEKPKSREAHILSSEMINHICFNGLYTLLICIIFLCSGFWRSFYGYDIGNIKFFTAFYALFIFFGIFNCFGARCERLFVFSNIEKNKAFIFIMILISVIQIGMIYFGGSLFRCTPLSPRELLAVILLSFSVIPFDFIRRIFYKLK